MIKILKSIFKLEIDSKRIFGLDILRAAAILFVVIAHGGMLLPEPIRTVQGYFIFDGVSIFFILSGYLIGGILIKILETQKANLPNLLNFWMRRWLRTIPLYFFILTILIVIFYVFKTEFNLSEYIKYYLFIQNINTIHPEFFSEAWSLTIEEWFYILAPIALFSLVGIFKMSPKKSVFYAAFVFIILITIYRYNLHLNLNITNIIEWDNNFRKTVLTRLDSLMYGVLAAFAHFYYGDHWVKYKYPYFIVGLIIMIVIRLISIYQLHGYGIYFSVFSFSLAAVGTALLLPFLSQLKTGTGFIAKSVTYISLISYSLYLTHLSLIQLWLIPTLNLSQYFNGNNLMLAQIFVYWTASIVLSLLLYKYFEIPCMNLRERFKPKNIAI